MVQDKGVWQLFVDGEMQINARWPNAFWDEYSTQSGGLQMQIQWLPQQWVLVSMKHKD